MLISDFPDKSYPRSVSPEPLSPRQQKRTMRETDLNRQLQNEKR